MCKIRNIDVLNALEVFRDDVDTVASHLEPQLNYSIKCGILRRRIERLQSAKKSKSKYEKTLNSIRNGY